MIPHEGIADFLSRRFAELERTCELAFAPGFEEFQLEIGRPTFEVRIDGALSGLTLELVAHYGDKQFVLDGKTEPSAYQRYFPDPSQANRFWRRNVIAERNALAEVERAGFSIVREGAFSLIRENQVARFLANTLPRWRQAWAVRLGSRLESVMAEIDIAQPEFSLRGGSGEDWLSLDLKLSAHGKPVPLDPAEIQRWLQTGQTHTRTANNRVLLVPTEAWGEMQEVLADCEVEQEPGAIRVARDVRAVRDRRADGAGISCRRKCSCRANAARCSSRPRSAIVGAASALPSAWRRVAGGSRAAQSSMACWPTTWASARRCRRSRSRAWLHATDRERILVVCPTSLVTNWLREAARFTPHLRALDLTGADRAQKFASRDDYDLLVTSYAILRRDVELYRAEEFSRSILDEAQHIKNRGSQNAQAAKALRAKNRLVLTGTPLENSLLDLWSIFDFLLPGYLGTAADFRERYETPLTQVAGAARDGAVAPAREAIFSAAHEEGGADGVAAEAGVPDVVRADR